MSEITTFRVNGYDLSDSSEFYLRIDDDAGYALCKLAIDHEGLSYYRPQSRILTQQENARTRNTPHYFLTMEELKELFEAQMKTGRPDADEWPQRFEITRRGRQVTIRLK